MSTLQSAYSLEVVHPSLSAAWKPAATLRSDFSISLSCFVAAVIAANDSLERLKVKAAFGFAIFDSLYFVFGKAICCSLFVFNLTMLKHPFLGGP